MLTLDEIKAQLQDANLMRVATNAGVHPASLYRIMRGSGQASYETVKKLSDYLQGARADEQK
jgi:DNA-binding phage protein